MDCARSLRASVHKTCFHCFCSNSVNFYRIKINFNVFWEPLKNPKQWLHLCYSAMASFAVAGVFTYASIVYRVPEWFVVWLCPISNFQIIIKTEKTLSILLQVNQWFEINLFSAAGSYFSQYCQTFSINIPSLVFWMMDCIFYRSQMRRKHMWLPLIMRCLSWGCWRSSGRRRRTGRGWARWGTCSSLHYLIISYFFRFLSVL